MNVYQTQCFFRIVRGPLIAVTVPNVCSDAANDDSIHLIFIQLPNFINFDTYIMIMPPAPAQHTMASSVTVHRRHGYHCHVQFLNIYALGISWFADRWELIRAPIFKIGVIQEEETIFCLRHFSICHWMNKRNLLLLKISSKRKRC